MTDALANSSRPKRIAIWVLRILLGGAFLFFSMMKLSGQPKMVAEFDTVGFGQWFRYFTGSLELMGGIAILIPRMSIFGAMVLLLVDLGALIAQVTILHVDWVHCVVIGVLLSLAIYLQRSAIGRPATPLPMKMNDPGKGPSDAKTPAEAPGPHPHTDFQQRNKSENSMTTRPRIALIIGSTRPTRFADKPAQWMLKQAQARDDMDVEVVDLRDHPLPFFAEMASNLHVPSKDPEAIRWQETIAGFDGFIFVVAEYNHSVTGALKNALDQAYKEWNRKPFTAIAYGGASGARALEHLRGIGIELQMVSTRSAVHIGGSDFMAVFPMGGNKPIEEIEKGLLPAAKAALDDLSWWAQATMTARAATA